MHHCSYVISMSTVWPKSLHSSLLLSQYWSLHDVQGLSMDLFKRSTTICIVHCYHTTNCKHLENLLLQITQTLCHQASCIEILQDCYRIYLAYTLTHFGNILDMTGDNLSVGGQQSARSITMRSPGCENPDRPEIEPRMCLLDSHYWLEDYFSLVVIFGL